MVPQLRPFKTKAFARFASREGIKDSALCEAVDRVQRGSIDADLGGGVIKQRIARKGGGRAGGFRTILLFRRGTLAFFVDGFSKSSRENVRQNELQAYRRLADALLAFDGEDIADSLGHGRIIEVFCDDQAIQE